MREFVNGVEGYRGREFWCLEVGACLGVKRIVRRVVVLGRARERRRDGDVVSRGWVG